MAHEITGVAEDSGPEKPAETQCFELNCASLQDTLQSLSPISGKMTLLGNRVFVDVIKLKCGHIGLEWSLIQ